MQYRSYSTSLKGLSLALAMTFFLQQVILAAPTITPPSLFGPKSPQIQFRIPESIALIEDSYLAPNATKTIFLMQDAHTNDSGQINLAKALEHILKGQAIQYVFTEAGEGDNSLSYIKKHVDGQTRHQVSMAFLRKGMLQGAEHLSLTGSTDFTLWGVESPQLYKEGLILYQRIAKKRERFVNYLNEVHRTAETLKTHPFML